MICLHIFQLQIQMLNRSFLVNDFALKKIFDDWESNSRFLNSNLATLSILPKQFQTPKSFSSKLPP